LSEDAVEGAFGHVAYFRGLPFFTCSPLNFPALTLFNHSCISPVSTPMASASLSEISNLGTLPSEKILEIVDVRIPVRLDNSDRLISANPFNPLP